MGEDDAAEDGAVGVRVLGQQQHLDGGDALRGQQARSIRQSLMQRLRKDAKVEINPKVLEQSAPPQQGI